MNSWVISPRWKVSVNKGFSFSAPKVATENSIERLSFDDFFEMSVAGDLLPAFPPRSLQQLITLVDEGRSHEISILEWLDVVENEQHWIGFNDQKVANACRAIWLAICTNDTLGNIAFFKAGLAIDGRPSTVVKPLLESMDIVRGVPGLNELDASRIDWLNAVKRKDWNALAAMCFGRLLPPRVLVKKLMLPNANTYLQHIPEYLVNCAPRSIDDNIEGWLSQCFHSLKVTRQQVVFCDALITQCLDRLYRGECKVLLEDMCLPDSDQTLWYELTDVSQAKLKQTFGLSNYYELSTISRALCSESGVIALDIDEKEQKQIRSRTSFWSNYSEQFNRTRVILPQATLNYLQEDGVRLSNQVSTFSNESEDCAEVFIFELERILVVEILRGEVSETRIFKNSEWNAKRLLDGDFNYIGDIRELPQTEVHDHLIVWQYFCEKLLRTKFKIKPNANVKYFAGIPKSVSAYSHDKGLQHPDKVYLAERAEQLEQWVEIFWRHEFKTSKYGQQSGLQQKSNLYLTKAQMAKQLGNQDDYELFIKKAANQGSSEAMWQLGKNMLLASRNDATQRKYGEDWIAKAASKGHLEAIETATKFRIIFTPHSPLSADTPKLNVANKSNVSKPSSRDEWDERNRERSQYLKEKYKDKKTPDNAVKVTYKKTRNYTSDDNQGVRDRAKHFSKSEWTARNRERSQYLRKKHK